VRPSGGRARRKEAELEIKARTLQARTEFEQESRGRREEIQNFENAESAEEILDRKLEVMDRRERELAGPSRSCAPGSGREQQERTGRPWSRRRSETGAGGRLDGEEAKAQLMQALEEEAKLYAAPHQTHRGRRQRDGRGTAKAIIGRAICRIASDYVAERRCPSWTCPATT